LRPLLFVETDQGWVVDMLDFIDVFINHSDLIFEFFNLMI
jgi:hypothetical protein